MTEIRCDGKFVKGVSGNPSGRPRVAPEVRELARAESVDAIYALSAIMRSERAPYVARIQSCNSILDRAWGKPMQSIESKNLNFTIDDFLSGNDADGNPFNPI